MLKPVWGLLLFLACGLASAQYRGVVVTSVCYNYGCAEEGLVALTPDHLAALKAMFADVVDAETERAAVAKAVGVFYRIAGEQTLVAADRAGNFLDQEVPGRMDCIDHSTSTSRILHIIDAEGLLRYHRVVEPVRRLRLIMQHFSAAIEEMPQTVALAGQGDTYRDQNAAQGSSSVHGQPGAVFVVDSWFVDNGQPAVILPLADWLDGAGPNVH